MVNLHERIAELLGWTEEEARTFSLPTLRELVRTKSPKLADEISAIIRNPDVYYIGPMRKRRRL